MSMENQNMQFHHQVLIRDIIILYKQLCTLSGVRSEHRQIQPDCARVIRVCGYCRIKIQIQIPQTSLHSAAYSQIPDICLYTLTRSYLGGVVSTVLTLSIKQTISCIHQTHSETRTQNSHLFRAETV